MSIEAVTFSIYPTMTVMTDKGPLQIMEGSLSELPEDAAESVKALAKKNIPLPYPFDTTKFEAAKKELVNLAQSEIDRKMIEKVTNALLRISFPMLVSQLRSCITEFNQKVGKIPYDAVTVAYASNQWITQLALKYGITPPNHVTYFEGSNVSSYSSFSSSAHTVVVLDDCSYSGSQAAGCIQCLTQLNMVYGANKQVVLNRRKPDPAQEYPIKEIYLIIPFVSAVAKKAIEDHALLAKKIRGIDIWLITGSISIPTAQEVLEEREYQRFQDLFEYDGEPVTQLGFADWRCPDGISIPRLLFEGEINYDPPVKTSMRLVPQRFKPYYEVQ